MLESMAAGVPVVATPVGAIPDVVVEGVHGLFVPPRDAVAIAEAIARLALDRDLLARMSAACRTRIAGAYSIAQLTQAFARVYSDLSGARQRMSPRPET
jgi:glycosyltransferase involved in cell wall biosynthesis